MLPSFLYSSEAISEICAIERWNQPGRISPLNKFEAFLEFTNETVIFKLP